MADSSRSSSSNVGDYFGPSSVPHKNQSITDSDPSTPLNVPESSSKIILDSDRAAPVYAPPRGDKKFGLEPGANGTMLADYVLFEESIQRSKVPWKTYADLTSEERDIYVVHLKSVTERKLNYKDPHSGLHVFNISHHLEKGKCCGNACRHCPYGHKNASKELKRSKRWNGAFYV